MTRLRLNQVAKELIIMGRYESFVCHVRITLPGLKREKTCDGKSYVCESQIREGITRLGSWILQKRDLKTCYGWYAWQGSLAT